MKKVLIILGVIVVALVLALFGVRRGRGGPEVRVAVAQKGKVIQIVDAEGSLEAREQVEVGSDVMGKIVEIRVSEGDTVRAGDTLCVIDPGVYREEYKAALANLSAQEARLKKAEEDLRRVRALFERGLVPKSRLEEAEANYEALKAQVEATRAQLGRAAESLRKAYITSPIDGVVVAVNKEVGEPVVVGVNVPGSVIMVVADLSQMIVKAEVDETGVPKVKPGQEARVFLEAFPDDTFKGRVLRVSGVPAEGSQSITYPVDILLEKAPEGALPGMSASCEIITGRKEGVLAVPLTALGRRGGKDVLFVYSGGKAHMREVKLGLLGQVNAEVLEGLSEGDTVIVGPADVLKELRDGEPVRIREKPKVKGRGKKPSARGLFRGIRRARRR